MGYDDEIIIRNGNFKQWLNYHVGKFSGWQFVLAALVLGFVAGLIA